MPPEGISFKDVITNVEKRLIESTLEAAGGVQKRAAELLQDQADDAERDDQALRDRPAAQEGRRTPDDRDERDDAAIASRSPRRSRARASFDARVATHS